MVLALALLVGLTGWPPALRGQPAAAPSRSALVLDGDGSYVELPGNLLAGQNEVTVEGWLNWAGFQSGSRFFDFGAGPFQISVQNRGTGSTLWFESPEGLTYKAATLPDMLATNEWIHVAAVRSTNGLHLIVNGNRLPTIPQSLTVAVRSDTRNLLGRSNYHEQFRDGDFRGRMAEVRVWSHARTEALVRSNLFAQLTGKEPGLLALYNFADPARPGRDATGRNPDGKLLGNAKVVEAQLPSPANLASAEQVLQLDGKTGYVELPPNALNDLEASTIEARLKWDRLDGPGWKRAFTYGAAGHDLGLGVMDADSLWFIISDAQMGFREIRAPGVLRAGEWIHVAAASGPGGMRLYANGFLIGTNAYAGSFAALRNGDLHRIGKTVTPNEADPPFLGQIDEVRVWKGVRTEEQIRRDMFRNLAGNEEGLRALWNFDDGTARDASPGRHHGTLNGDAKIVTARRPNPQALARVVVLSGTVTDDAGRPLRNADVVLIQDGAELKRTRTGIAGEYRLQLRQSENLAFELRVTKDTLGNVLTGSSLAESASKPLNFTLYEAPSVSGSILSAEKRPRAGVRVQLENVAQTNLVTVALSNSRGEYRFKNVPPGQYRVRAAGAGGPVYFADGRILTVAERTPPNQADVTLPASTSPAPPAATNLAARLGGGESYIKLPSHSFDGLDEATVEGWVRWDRIGNWMRFFDFGKERQSMLLGNRGPNPDLTFELWNAEGVSQGYLTAPGVIQTNRWCHLAVVTGKGGMRVYFNGLLVITHNYPGSFTAIRNGDHNYLGRNNFKGSDPSVEDFEGALDEVRVWVTQRTEAEIREGMFQRLTGREDGLAGLWNFDDPNRPGRDGTPNHFDAELIANTRVAPTPLPAPADLENPILLVGKVTDTKGRLQLDAEVRAEQDGKPPKQATVDAKGEFRLLLPKAGGPVTLSAQSTTPEGRLLSSFQPNLVFQPGETRHDLQLREFASLSGRVVALDQTPLEAVVVQAVSERPPLPAITGGLAGEYFRLPSRPERFPDLPADAVPVATNRVPEITFMPGTGWLPLHNVGENEGFYGRWTGSFTLDQPRRISFHLIGGPGARLFIDGKTVIDLGVNGQGGEKTEAVDLAAGEHRVKIDALRRATIYFCVLTWQLDGYPPSPFPTAEPFKAATLTDEKGEFRFPDLAPARYLVRAQVPGEHVYAGPTAPADGPPAGAVAEVTSAAAARPEARPAASNENHATRFTVVRGRETSGLEIRTAPFKKGRWKTYTRLDGLAHDQVVDLLEAKDGAMWFATFGGGASRWDGRQFQNHTTADGLVSDAIWKVAEDHSGALWFTTLDRGVSRWSGGKFQTFTDQDGLASTNQVGVLFTDRDGVVWFGTDRGASSWDGKSFHTYTTTNGLPGNNVTAIGQGKDGALWVGTDTGVARKVGANFVPFTGPDVLAHGTVTGILGASDGSMWFALRSFGNAAAHWDGSRLVTHAGADGLLGGRILSMAEDRKGNIWFGTAGQGLVRFDGTSFVTYTTADGLAQNRVHAVHQDRDGVIWCGTFGGGLSRFEGDSLAPYTKADGLESQEILALGEDRDGGIWIGTAGGGVARWDGRHFTGHTTANGLPNNSVTAIQRDRSGAMWLGTQGGLARWTAGRFETFTQTDGLVENNVLALHEDGQGQLWIGTGGGLSRWDGKRFENYTKADGLLDGPISHIAQGQDGILWFQGSSSGFSRWTGKGFDNLTVAPGLPIQHAMSIYADPQGGIWAGFDTLGVARWDGKNFRPYTPADGLGATYAVSIFSDSDGIVWFGLDDMVSLFNGVAWASVSLDAGQKRNRERQVTALLQARDGAVWMGTMDGLFRYEKSRPLRLRPNLRLTAGKEYTDLDKLPTLTTGDRVTFDFGYIDRLTQPEKQQFRYQITAGTPSPGQLATNGAWSRPAGTTHVDWTTNRAGTYTFAVQYFNQDLRASEPTLATYTLRVPWHANAVIMLPAGLGVGGLAIWAMVARTLYTRKRREAERLREQLLEEEHRANEALAAKAAALAESNRQLDVARAAAESARVSADEANQAKSSFLANMSHELRTPMNAIIGYSEMLQEEAEDLEQRSFIPDLQKIHGAGKHLLGLINDILDLSKIEAGKMTLYLEEFEVAQLLREVEATVQPLIGKNSNTLVVDCPADTGRMRADLTKVRQVLFNLLSNAAKFTKNGAIRLTVARAGAGPQITFQVSDSGIGMNAEQLGKLFQAFEQADKSTSKQFGGTGLGLALSRKFCQIMGGDITVTSTPGQGSTFTVTLPVEVVDAQLPAESPPPATLPSTARNGGPLLLVIDDDPNVRDLLHRNLTKHGYRVEVAADGASGLEMAKKIQPQAITLDVMMPGLDGWTVLSQLKNDPATADIPVIMVSMLDDLNLGISLGAVDLLTKPVDWAQLHRLLQRHARASLGEGILLVDDEPGTREMMRRQLEKAGWAVIEAAHGKMALACLEQATPALILLDLMMPEMDGFDFLDELRRQPQGRTIPVIVVTAMELSGRDRERLNGQVLRILQKASVSVEELTEQIRAAIGPGCP